MSQRARRGFALRDLLACVAIAAILTPALLAVGLARERARQASCKSNISNIGKVLYLYMSDNGEDFPWVVSDNRWDAATGESRLKPPSPQTNYNVSALLFMLVRYCKDPNIFICPSTQDLPEPNPKTKDTYNWDFSPWKDGNAEHLSYSYQAPLCQGKSRLETPPRVVAPAPLFMGGANEEPDSLDFTSGVSSNSDSGLVVLADRTPAYEGLKPDFNWADPGKGDPNTGMSQNHGGAMINLLYADTHVGESRLRADCGVKKDNIYSAAGVGKDGKPLDTCQGPGSLKLSDHRSPNDSFLLGPKKMEK